MQENQKKVLKQAIINTLKTPNTPLLEPTFTAMVQEGYRQIQAKKHSGLFGAYLKKTDKKLEEHIMWVKKRLIRVRAESLASEILPILTDFRTLVNRTVTPLIRNVYLLGGRWEKAFDSLYHEINSMDTTFERKLHDFDALVRPHEIERLHFFQQMEDFVGWLHGGLKEIQQRLTPPQKGEIYEVLEDMLQHNKISPPKREVIRQFLSKQGFI